MSFARRTSLRAMGYALPSDIPCSAEKAVNDRLAQTPELYLLALAQFAVSADTDMVRARVPIQCS